MQFISKGFNPVDIEVSSDVVCIVSGGLDSICTAAYLKKESNCTLNFISFMYGQRANIEIQAAKHFAKILKVKNHRTINIEFMKDLYSNSNVLTDPKELLPNGFDYTIVVPIRNVIFISIASAWAMSLGATVIAYGAHANDNHYPDCRPEFIKSIISTLNLAEKDGIQLGLRRKITIWAPVLAGMSKSRLLKKGYSLLGDKIFDTWSCYSNGTKIKGISLHCGQCESCNNRRLAFRSAGIDDRTQYAKNE